MECVISCYFSGVKIIRYDCGLDRNPVKLMNCAYLFSVCNISLDILPLYFNYFIEHLESV